MDLDVLFPFHRVDKFLYEAIDSINQSQSVNFNLIVIDDRLDRSQDISELFKSVKNYQILKTTGGSGYGFSLKEGLNLLQAPHTALFNSDDLVDPSRFRKQLQALDDSELSITSIKRIGSDGSHASSLSGSIRSKIYDPIYLLLGSYGANASWCMHRDWWKENAFYDSYECLDWRIAMTAFPTTQISYLSESLYFYRKHELQITANKKLDSILMEPVYQKWLELAHSLEINNNSRSIFDLIATPWLFSEGSNFSTINTWVNQFITYSKKFDNEVGHDLLKLIQRRYFFASINRRNSISNRLNFALHSFPQLLPLMREFIF